MVSVLTTNEKKERERECHSDGCTHNLVWGLKRLIESRCMVRLRNRRKMKYKAWRPVWKLIQWSGRRRCFQPVG